MRRGCKDIFESLSDCGCAFLCLSSCEQVRLPLSWWCSVLQRASGCSATWTTTQRRWKPSGSTSTFLNLSVTTEPIMFLALFNYSNISFYFTYFKVYVLFGLYEEPNISCLFTFAGSLWAYPRLPHVIHFLINLQRAECKDIYLVIRVAPTSSSPCLTTSGLLTRRWMVSWEILLQIWIRASVSSWTIWGAIWWHRTDT